MLSLSTSQVTRRFEELIVVLLCGLYFYLGPFAYAQDLAGKANSSGLLYLKYGGDPSATDAHVGEKWYGVYVKDRTAVIREIVIPRDWRKADVPLFAINMRTGMSAFGKKTGIPLEEPRWAPFTEEIDNQTRIYGCSASSGFLFPGEVRQYSYEHCDAPCTSIMATGCVVLAKGLPCIQNYRLCLEVRDGAGKVRQSQTMFVAKQLREASKLPKVI